MSELIASMALRGGGGRLPFVRGLSQENENHGLARICHCGVVALLRTSWIENNPGRRLFGCHNYRQGKGCGYFVWHGDQMGERPREVINELLGQIERLYEENVRQRRGEDNDTRVEAESGAMAAEMKKNEIRLKVVMGVLLATWVFIFVYHICS